MQSTLSTTDREFATQIVTNMTDDDKCAIIEAGDANAWRNGISDMSERDTDVSAVLAEVERLINAQLEHSQSLRKRLESKYGL